jgi:hypothetical protein
MNTSSNQRQDHLGNRLTAASRDAVALYDQAIHELQCYRNDPVATVQSALDADPSLVMGHVLHGYLHLLGTEPSGFPVAATDLEAAEGLPANDREAAHRRALGHLVRNEWRAAGRVLEDIAIAHPHDALALQVGHLVDFYTGDSRMLRDRIARALPYWSRDMPGYHAILGMHAFGLEETGLYTRAEAAGRRAVELESKDAWAWHAVAHVLEMQTRRSEGVAWLRQDSDAWSKDNFFAVHNWWHLAICHLDLEETDEVLALFDGPIYGQRSQLALDLIDASALLWRLHLKGVPLGERWEAVADAWEPMAAAGNYAFNDAHAMMAFVGASRPQAVQAILDAQAEGAGRGRRQRSVHAGGWGAGHPRHPGLWRGGLRGGGAPAASGPESGPALRRQPRPARPARSDPDRGRSALWPAGPGPGPHRRADRPQARQPRRPDPGAARPGPSGPRRLIHRQPTNVDRTWRSHMNARTIAPVRPGEQPRCIGTLVSAFADDPVARWVFSEPGRYLDYFPRVLKSFAAVALRDGTAWEVDGFSGTAVWLAPE